LRSQAGSDYDVLSLGPPKIDIVVIEAKTDDEKISITAPVEQVCFTAIISTKKANGELPREV